MTGTNVAVYEWELFKKEMFPYWTESFTEGLVRTDDGGGYDEEPIEMNGEYIYVPDSVSSNDFLEQVFGWNCAIVAIKEYMTRIVEARNSESA